MAAVDDVVGARAAAHTGRHRLLPDAQVHEPVHLVRARQLADALLEDADPPHRAQELEPFGRLELRPCPRRAMGEKPSTCWTAATIFASSGRRYSSIGWL